MIDDDVKESDQWTSESWHCVIHELNLLWKVLKLFNLCEWGVGGHAFQVGDKFFYLRGKKETLPYMLYSPPQHKLKTLGEGNTFIVFIEPQWRMYSDNKVSELEIDFIWSGPHFKHPIQSLHHENLVSITILDPISKRKSLYREITQ